ncbi:MAG TPA: glutathione S-transferase family protein [Rhizomicrobium sp.]|jgi:glutathione S-transferase|nr:glutathione S-transferase family protein [Rhizomicrobium sp.]
MALVVYGSSLSPFVRKVRVVLAEKGLDYSIEQINPFDPPAWFGDISPLKRIPVLRDTNRPEPNTLPDSSVICAYLEAGWPVPQLYPADPFARAQALWFEEYADTQMMQSLIPVFFERVVRPLSRARCDESIVASTLTEKVPPVFDYLETCISAHRFFAGDSFSIADISVAAMLANFQHGGEELDASRWPELARFAREAHERPSFANCLAKERSFLERYLPA